VNEREATDFRDCWLVIDRLRKKQTSPGQPYAFISKVADNDQSDPADPPGYESDADQDPPAIKDPKQMSQRDRDKNNSGNNAI